MIGAFVCSETVPVYRKVKRDPKVMQLKRRKRDLEEFNESFQSNAPTFIIVHGWKSSTQSDTVQNIKNGYLMTRECNVIGMEMIEHSMKTLLIELYKKKKITFHCSRRLERVGFE